MLIYKENTKINNILKILMCCMALRSSLGISSQDSISVGSLKQLILGKVPSNYNLLRNCQVRSFLSLSLIDLMNTKATIYIMTTVSEYTILKLIAI